MSEKRTKKSLTDLVKMKARSMPTAWITAYDLPFASCAERADVDMILVGDSGGMVQLGHQTTNPVTMDEMIILARAARRGAPNTFIIGDMPQGTYETCERDAVINSLRFIKEVAMDAVKCEGGHRMVKQITAMVNAGILVMGHLGLTPQSTGSFGGYRVQGKTRESFDKTIEDAFVLQEAGVFAILLEGMPEEPAEQIARQLKIPIYGIGAGGNVDGQLVIMHDLMGFYQAFRPYFAKCYVPTVAAAFSKYLSSVPDMKQMGRAERCDGMLVLVEMAIAEYVKDVRNGCFPGKEYTYPIKDSELAELRTSQYWKPVNKLAASVAVGAVPNRNNNNIPQGF